MSDAIIRAENLSKVYDAGSRTGKMPNRLIEVFASFRRHDVRSLAFAFNGIGIPLL